MKHTKNIIIMFLLLLTWAMPVLSPIPAAASSTKLNTAVPTHVVLTIEIHGKGSVWVNGKRITRTAELLVPRNEQIIMQFQPRTGYHTAQVKLDESNAQLNNDVLLMENLYQNHTVSVTFVKNSFIGIDDNPPTGDHFTTAVASAWSFALMLLLLLCLLKYQKFSQKM